MDTNFATKTVAVLTKDHTIVIFGAAREGSSTYTFLRSYLPRTTIWIIDDKKPEELDELWQKNFSQDSLLHYSSIQEIPKHIANNEPILLFKTPGIPLTHPLFTALADHSVTLTSNTELFFQLLTALPSESIPTTIGVTGTKGKSTTTSLIAHVLQAGNKPTFIAGNIGVPALTLWEELENLKEKSSEAFVVLELSSHQLKELSFSPHIAVLQDITPEHLDYYQNFEEYWQAKARITQFQSNQDILIIDPDFELPKKIADSSRAQKLFYSLKNTTPQIAASLQGGSLYFKEEKIIDTADLPLLGEHNLLNIFPSIIIGKLVGLETETIAQALTTFKPLEHRLEFVAEKNGVQYYNDSQGTTPEAAIAAISSFPEKNIILLAGGSDKGVTFSDLAQTIVRKKVTHLLLFPPIGKKIGDEVKILEETQTPSQGSIFISEVNSMQEAVQMAQKNAKPGSIVLLSPACASFGLFKNYQDRGNQFKESVLSISPTTAI